VTAKAIWTRILGLMPGGLDEVATGGYFVDMRSVGIKVLKNRLSEYVRLAASGETVLVTDRDKVVAELVPPRTGRAEELHDAVLADAVRRGWLTPATMPRGSLPPRQPVMSWEELAKGLDADREDR
jgi:antitoxin (DNA-binding transcriptional repressor) of toxin-antitoxin stability system